MAEDENWQSETSMKQKRSTFHSIDHIEYDVVERLFRLFQDSSGSKTISMDNLFKALEEEGIRLTDPRLKEFIERVKGVSGTEVDMETLERLLHHDVVYIANILRHHLIVPDFRSFCKNIEEMFSQCADIKDGNVASYIPELSKADAAWWGMSVCTVDGQRFSKGDVTIPFTLQSCSKPLTYALASQKLGSKKVHEYVGQEPSGLIFNALVLDTRDKPHNPMINPGAIILCGLLRSLVFENMSSDEALSRLMMFIKDLAGDEYIGFSNDVYLSEKRTGFRNYAIGYLMMEKKCFPPSITVEEVLNLYYKSCSIEANVESLSVIAATLANGGVCPLTNKMVIGQETIRNMLSLMQSCGMYDYSGQFAFKIGLPAKSGVSGAMMLVIPSVMGICLWSPPLDPIGNSPRCLRFCELLLESYCLHPYSHLGHAVSKQVDPTRRPGRYKEENVIRILGAASRGDLNALRCYYLRDMNMNEKDYDGRTALHVAAAEGHADCVRFLVETCHVDVNLRDRFGRTPRKDAEDFGNSAVVNILKCTGAVV